MMESKERAVKHDIESDYINTKQAAHYIGDGTNPRTVIEWMKTGKLKHKRNPTARGRYKTTVAWIEEALSNGALPKQEADVATEA